MYIKAHLFLVSFVLIFCLVASVSFGQSTKYTYDDLNRLTKVEYSNGTVIEYIYDEVGNRISEIVTAAAKLLTSIPDGMGAPGTTVDIPVEVGNTTGMGITSVSLTVTYDNSLLTATGASTTGTIAESWGTPTYSVTPGQIIINMSSGTSLTGAGKLLNISFNINSSASCGSATAITLANVALNAGAIPANLQNGVFTIAKYGDVSLNCQVTPYDASLVLQYSVGMITLTPLQLILAEVSDNGSVTPYDAALILQYSVGIIIKFPCEEPDKGLLASSALDAKQAPPASLTANIPKDTTEKPEKSDNRKIAVQKASSVPVAVSLPKDATGEPGNIITIPINISDVTGKGIISFWLKVAYDNSLLTATGASTTGAIAESWGAPTYFVTPGQISIGIASAMPLVGSGTLLYINFRVSNTAAVDSKSNIKLNLVELNERTIHVTSKNGSFTVTGNHPPVAKSSVYSTNEDTVLNIISPVFFVITLI